MVFFFSFGCSGANNKNKTKQTNKQTTTIPTKQEQQNNNTQQTTTKQTTTKQTKITTRTTITPKTSKTNQGRKMEERTVDHKPPPSKVAVCDLPGLFDKKVDHKLKNFPKKLLQNGRGR